MPERPMKKIKLSGDDVQRSFLKDLFEKKWYYLGII